MSKSFRYALFAACIALSMGVIASPDRFPSLRKLPEKPREAIATVMDWQRTLVDLKASEIEARFGKPDKVIEADIDAASGKRDRTIYYRLSRRSELQITIKKDEVMAVALISMPSGNEAGPIDD
ncbi:MAG: hypothetical protein ABIO49_04330 [Dokdonella sp.]